MAQTVNLNIQPKVVNVPVDKRSDTVYIFELVDEAESPLDMNGLSAKMELRHYPAAKSVLDSLTTQNGRLVIDGSRIRIVFPYEVTTAYKFDRAVYDLALITQDRVYRVAQGEITFDPEVTR